MSHVLAASYLILASSIVPAKVNSPEQTLDNYINCLRIGSEQCVLNYYYGVDSFYVPEPRRIDYQITNKIALTQKDVDKWNKAGIVPKAEVGDIRLVTLEKIDSYEGTFNYYLRKYDDTWLIYSAGGVD